MPNYLIQNVNHVPQIQERLLQGQKEFTSAVLLLTDKYETSSMYYSLAYQFRTNFVFGECRAKNLKLAQKFGLKKYPLLMAFVPKGTGNEDYDDDYDIYRYKGELKKDAISKWLDGIVRVQKKRDTAKRRHSEF